MSRSRAAGAPKSTDNYMRERAQEEKHGIADSESDSEDSELTGSEEDDTGMNAMLEKYKNADFGRCPRVFCNGQPCLPVGQTDVARMSTVKIFCPKCADIYYPRSKYQGTRFRASCMGGSGAETRGSNV
eukprot:scaffold2229_cov413-Prasinococcus_capsulatus_cf.AAC.3